MQWFLNLDHSNLICLLLVSMHQVHPRNQNFILQQLLDQGLQPTLPNTLKQARREGVMDLIYPKMMQLLELGCLIPCSTATVERGFSLMNSLCTNLRNRLNQSSLDFLMRICKEGKDNFSNDELEAMVDLFKNKKNRKLEF